MHTCIPSHKLKRSRHSCPIQVISGSKKTQHAPSTKMECDYLKFNGWIKKTSHRQKSPPKMVNPRDIAGERRKRRNTVGHRQQSHPHMINPRYIAGECRRRRRIKKWSHRQKCHPKMVNPRDTAGKCRRRRRRRTCQQQTKCASWNGSDNCTCCHTELEVTDKTFSPVLSDQAIFDQTLTTRQSDRISSSVPVVCFF